MKKKVKTVCQIIRFRGKIEAFLVSIDEFNISKYYTCWILGMFDTVRIFDKPAAFYLIFFLHISQIT